jgi:hypothetical protein
MRKNFITKSSLPILTLRGERVVLDSDLARIYGVTTGRFNEAVKRNLRRFPSDFSFVVNREEYEELISQNAISKPGRGGRTKLPRLFTEHGALMAAGPSRECLERRLSNTAAAAFTPAGASASADRIYSIVVT